MKIDRRCFLSFIIGGAVGTTLTPMPWKLTDDIAIWTQNWSWTPVPEDGPVKYEKSVCAACPGGCGIKVRTIKNRAVKIEGDPDNPVNRGSICPMGLSSLQHLYGPARIKAPMKRTGERGEGKWEKISWDEALSQVADRLSELRDKDMPHTVACIAEPGRSTVNYLLDRFLGVYGSPNFIRTPSSSDANELALELTQGRQATAGWDLENSDFIMSFGYPLLDAPAAAGRMFSEYARLDKKASLVQVEPRLSDTASRADRWIPAKPGTEGILALGIAHVIVRDRLYDRDFVENRCFGFEDWQDENDKKRSGFKTFVKECTPEKVADITGIDKKTIESLAKDFAGSKRPVAVSGGTTVAGGLDGVLAVHALNALTGSINRKGGMIAVPEPDYLSWSELQIDETASRGRQKPRVDRAGTDLFPSTRHLLHLLPDAINSAGDQSPVQALLVAGGNPLYTLPDTEAAKQAFDRIPFIASFSTYMDETAAYADLLLPNHHFLERYEDAAPSEGVAMPVIGLAKPVVKPVHDTLHTGDAVMRIARQMGGFIEEAFPWEGYEDFLEKTLADQWKTLEKQGYWEDDSFDPYNRDESFYTVSEKYEFLPRTGQIPPEKDPDKLLSCSPEELPGDSDQFPLFLIPYTSMRIAGGAVANPPFMTKTVDDNVIKKDEVFVEINPETAEKQGLRQGDAAVLKTPSGEAEVRIHLFEGVMPGLVAMPTGLGHTEFSDYISGKGANAYALVAGISDPASGLNRGWGSRASLSKA